MKNEYTNALYEKIKDSFADKKKSGFKNVLKTKPENTYVVRLIPNADNPDKTLFQYFMHGWTSPVDGRYTGSICPTTYGEDCPICNERFRLWNKGDEESKELSKKFARKERFYANVLVVDDPVTEENNGTVKILGYGRQLAKIIEEAMSGEDADEVGGRMFDFSKEGCNLRIKVEKNSAGFPNYVSSKFLKSSSISISYEDAVEQMHDFDPLLIRKTQDEMKEMLETSMYGVETTPEPQENAIDALTKENKASTEDDIPMEFDTKSADEDILAELENL